MSKTQRSGRWKRGKDGLTEVQRQFLDALLELHEVKATCEALGISRSQHYHVWLKEDAYKAAHEALLEEVNIRRADRVREAVQKAAFEGVEEEIVEEERAMGTDADGNATMIPVRQKVRKTRRISQAALLWEANYLWGNPQRLEVTGKDGGSIDINVRNRAMETLVGRLDAMALKLNGSNGSAPKMLPKSGNGNGAG